MLSAAANPSILPRPRLIGTGLTGGTPPHREIFTRFLAHVAALAVLLAFAGCGLTNEAAPTPGLACLDASGIAASMFAKGATGAGTELVAARAIKSHDSGNLYVVAIYFSVDGTEDHVGVWVANSLEPTGGLTPVDATAKEYSARGEAPGETINTTATDASITDARSCLN